MRRYLIHSFPAAFLLGLVAVTALPSCSQEGFPGRDTPSPEPELCFGLEETALPVTGTRSVLTGADIEGRKTCVTLAAYSQGRLYAAQDYTSEFGSMHLSLASGFTYHVYALVNMGAMASSFPALETGVAAMTYEIPSYTDGASGVNARGIPMAGQIPSLSVDASTAGTQAVPVRRLLSRVSATLSCDWSGAVIQNARVCNMNRVLRPFGVSAATGPADMLPFRELQDGTGGPTLSATFYVPENMQGTVPGIAGSFDKSRDRNETIGGIGDRLTYLEVSVLTENGQHAGSVTYRSYLGANETTDFNIERNYSYVWTVTYHGDNIQDYDWKRDADSFRITVTADRTTAYVGETVQLTATYRGISHGTPDGPYDVTAWSGCSWSRTSGSGDLSVTDDHSSHDMGRVSATAPGSAVFRAVYGNGTYAAWADSPQITFLAPATRYRYAMELSDGTRPASAAIPVGGTQGYRVRRYADIYHGETLWQQDAVGELLPPTAGYWLTGSSAVATVSRGTVTGTGQGTTTVLWRLAPTGAADCSGSVTVSAGTVDPGFGWDDDWDDQGTTVI